MMKRTVIHFLLFLLLVPVMSVAAQDYNFEEEAPPVYTFPEIPPGLDLSLGYRFVDYEDSKRADEYENLEDSISFRSEMLLFLFPHRLHLDIDFKDSNDYFGDLRYAYGDIIVMRGLNKTIYHNLENLNINPTNSASGYSRRDMDEDYNVRVGMTNAFLRFKAPDFPFHVFFTGDVVQRKGTVQQRSLLGSGSYGNLVIDSQSRDVDLLTTRYSAGINSHLGPVEAEYIYSNEQLSVSGDGILYDTYNSPIYGSVVFPHNEIPEITGSANTLKLHTAYTGKIVGAAMISMLQRENEENDAEATYFLGEGSIAWFPVIPLDFYLKYRHKESDFDTPDSTSLVAKNNSSIRITDNDVRKAVSSRTDTLSLTGRYKVMRDLSLKAAYTYELHDRDDADEWSLEETTERNIASLSADARPLKSVKLSLNYSRKSIVNPSYNTEPDTADEGKAILTWTPWARFNTQFAYKLVHETRDDLQYDESTTSHNREVDRSTYMGTVNIMVLKDLSLHASYSCFMNRTRQDIVYIDTSGTVRSDSDVTYEDSASSYFLGANYHLNDHADLGGNVTHVISKGSFGTDSPDLGRPIAIDDLSRLEIEETTYAVTGSYRMIGGIQLGVEYKYIVLEDVEDNENDDVEDGSAQLIWIMLSKKWG